MSEPRRPEDGSTQESSPSWDQPASTGPDSSAASQPASPPYQDPLTGTPTPEPAEVTSEEPAWTPAQPPPVDAPPPQTPAYEPVSTDTTYQPAYTPPADQPPAYPPQFQQPPAYPPAYQQQEQPPYPPQYQQAAYQQPASAWGQSAVVDETRDHAHSLAVALASLFLGFWGLLFTLVGMLFLVGGAGFTDLIRNDPQLEGIDPAQIDQVMGAFGVGAVIMLLIGIPHLLAALGAPFHKGWARWVGVIVSILGILLGVLILSGGSSSTVINDQRVTVSTIGPALFVIVPYGLALLALIFSRRHFRS
jgi:uncharacterized membrane protein YedE/YeeE